MSLAAKGRWCCSPGSIRIRPPHLTPPTYWKWTLRPHAAWGDSGEAVVVVVVVKEAIHLTKPHLFPRQGPHNH